MKHYPGTLLLSFVVSLIFLAACQPPPSTSPATPRESTAVAPSIPSASASLTPTALSDRVSEEGYRVEISLSGLDGRTAISTFIAATTSVRIGFRPMKDVVTTRKDGSASRYSTDWKPNSVAEMRYCTGIGSACTLPADWAPFSSDQTVNVDVTWLGDKDWGIQAQFRDISGKIIPAGYAKTDIGSMSIVISSKVDNSVPLTSLPPAAQTLVAQELQAYPVTGSITINQGRMTGGRAGDTVQIPVQFSAASPAGPVTEMRLKQDAIGRCLSSDEMRDSSWQPFKEQMTVPYRVVLNWTTFKLHVQYKDSRGNLSTVYCHDIGVEGSP